MAMDKYLLILLAALLLASCSANDSEEQAGGSAIAGAVSFDVTTDDAATRGIIANTQAFLTDGRQFRVWAFMQNGNDPEVEMTSDYNSHGLQDVIVTYVAYRDEWTTTETYYWPRPKYAVSFYAVYPNSDIFNKTNKTLDYTVPVDNSTQDVMYATAYGQRDGTEKANERKGVELKFHHALSQISFYGKLTTTLESFGWTIDVNSITLCNVMSHGELPMNVIKDPVNDHLATQFTSPSLSTPVNYSFVMNTDRTTISDDTEYILLTSPTDVTMLLPQSLTAWNKTTEITPSATNIGSYLKIGLRIKDATNYVLGDATTDAIVYAPFDCGVAGGWLAGQHYKYKLAFNGGYNALGHPVIKDISISAAIAPWMNDENIQSGSATHQPANP